MQASFVLLNLAGYVALLLWGLYMVQTGILRAFGSELRRFLGMALRNRAKAFLSGLFATGLLQSSTAVGLLIASFSASQIVGLTSSLSLMLGANVGTTLIVQLFSFDIAKVAPIIILTGFVIFKFSNRSNLRDFARFVIGIGIMFLALKSITLVLQPAEDSESIKLLLQAISQDHLLDMMFAALLTWLMHSSVAVVLLAMSLVTQGLVPLDVSFALVLGANLGGAVNPLIETDSKGNPSRHRLPFGNLINRAVGCLIFLPALGLIDYLPAVLKLSPARAVASFHTVFNITMALIFFPLLPFLSKFLQRILPDRVSDIDTAAPLYLDPLVIGQPSLALANASREALRMADIAEKMLRGVMDLLQVGDRKKIIEINTLDDVMAKLNQKIKGYVTTIGGNNSEIDSSRAKEILSFVTNFEHIASVASGLAKLGGKKIESKVVFSAEGWDELKTMLGRIIDNVRLASSTFMTRDLRTAKQLMAEKSTIRDMEMVATESHFKRLREGRRESVETSTLHLDIVRDLKRINSHLTSIAAPVLEENGSLLKTRLI